MGRVTRRRRAEIARIVASMPAEQRSELVTALVAFSDAAGEPVPGAGRCPRVVTQAVR